jgi:hypothetical protein
MNLIQQVTSDPLQKQNLVLPDGSILTMTMYFRPMQLGWFVNEMVWQNFTLDGLRITVNPNMLRQFKNQIPFGFACIANRFTREPTQQQDFSSGAFSLYLLTAAEVQQYENFLAGIPIG